jgi:hypothetical protein
VVAARLACLLSSSGPSSRAAEAFAPSDVIRLIASP